jgi:uncharacterized protein (DUF1697 family)
MKTYISMLRGINVSGQKTIRMAELKKMYEALGFSAVQTYLQSGNVVFSSDDAQVDAARLTARIEAQIEETFGFSVSILIRDARDFQRIVANNPFLNGRNEETGNLYVTFLSQAPTPLELAKVKTPPGETAEFIPGAQEIFLFVPDGYGRTKLSNTFFEKKLHQTATTRNWNTVQALLGMAGEPD